MKSIKTEHSNLEIGKGQPEYQVLHAQKIDGPEGELLMCFELDEEEIAAIYATHRIYYSRLRFSNTCENCLAPLKFQPMRIFTFDPNPSEERPTIQKRHAEQLLMRAIRNVVQHGEEPSEELKKVFQEFKLLLKYD